MKLLLNRYRIKPIQETLNKSRLISSLLDSLKKVHYEFRESGKLKDLPANVNKKRKKLVSVLDSLTDEELKYSDSIIVNTTRDFLITWFKFNGVANIAIEVKDDHFLMHSRYPNTNKKVTTYFESKDELLKEFIKLFNSIPNVS
jgi:hypothetical protein